jgi:hypothetical protein
VPFLRASLSKPAAADPRAVARLIAELDDDRFAVRENASRELAKRSAAIEGALRQALERHPSAEVKRRLGRLLENLAAPAQKPERLRELRAVEALERIGTPEARQVLHELADDGTATPLAQDAKAAAERLANRLPRRGDGAPDTRRVP